MTTRALALGRALIAALGLAAIDCNIKAQKPEGSDVEALAESVPSLQGDRAGTELVTPYPRARWRLASAGALSNTVLWVSHILVRHERSSDRVPGTLSPWVTDAPRPQRTRAGAFQLAQSIADEAAADPG